MIYLKYMLFTLLFKLLFHFFEHIKSIFIRCFFFYINQFFVINQFFIYRIIKELENNVSGK